MNQLHTWPYVIACSCCCCSCCACMAGTIAYVCAAINDNTLKQHALMDLIEQNSQSRVKLSMKRMNKCVAFIAIVFVVCLYTVCDTWVTSQLQHVLRYRMLLCLVLITLCWQWYVEATWVSRIVYHRDTHSYIVCYCVLFLLLCVGGCTLWPRLRLALSSTRKYSSTILM